ncbi:MAG TPA: hypothetical protein VEO74_01020, partial [Thermoanaerobaculia bacterium]|nr:hypothetical protein [Thermoanaerobaculia bacterium]
MKVANERRDRLSDARAMSRADAEIGSEADGFAFRPLTPDASSADRRWHCLRRLGNGHLVDDEIAAEIADQVTQSGESLP